MDGRAFQIEPDGPIPARCARLQSWSRTFTVNPAEWQAHSALLTPLLAKNKNQIHGHVQTYFVNLADEVLEQILQYMLTTKPPIFYNNVKGHDFAAYDRLLHGATYLGLTHLACWIRSRRYLEAVKLNLRFAKHASN
jgi:hypothetical protein